MKKLLSLLMAFLLALGCVPAVAEARANPALPGLSEGGASGEVPPEKPDGELAGGTPPELPDGEAPGNPPEKPAGGAPGGQGPGGGAPESYAAVYEITEDAELTGAIESTGTDENAVHVSSGALKLSEAAIVRSSEDSAGGDAASFYGVGAAVLATGGSAEISGSIIDTDAHGARACSPMATPPSPSRTRR